MCQDALPTQDVEQNEIQNENQSPKETEKERKTKEREEKDNIPVCTGILESHPGSRDVKIGKFSLEMVSPRVRLGRREP